MISKTLRPVFGQKHMDYMTAAKQSTMSVAEGAVRAGKTIDNLSTFAWFLQNGTPDRIHLVTGSTAANAKLNVGDANGYGLEYIFRGQCKWTKYRGNEALVIKPQKVKREYVVIFAGGGKADSFKKIRGNSFGMWIATEINLHHEDTIREAFNRQLAARNRRIFWDLNPSNPNHWIYTDYIDRFPEQFGDGYNYEHFTIRDNATISPTRLREIEAQYIPGSVWYRRDILGQRCTADGLIYQYFADNTEEFLIDNPMDWASENNKRFCKIMIGVDFGGTKSHTAFKAVGITNDWYVVVLDEEHIDSVELDPDKLQRRFCGFVERVQPLYGRSQTRADNEESVLIRGLQNAVKKARLETAVLNCIKMPINDRIKLTTMLMAQGRLKINRKCEHMIDAFSTAIYDPDRFDDVRLDDGTSDIDSLDALEYTMEPWYNQLIRATERNDKSVIW